MNEDLFIYLLFASIGLVVGELYGSISIGLLIATILFFIVTKIVEMKYL